MSTKQSPLEPAYSGSGAPASAISSPAVSVVASKQNAGAPGSSYCPATAPLTANTSLNDPPVSAITWSPLHQSFVGGTANSSYGPGNGAPASTYPGDSIWPDANTPLHSPPSYSHTSSTHSLQIRPSSYQQHKHDNQHNHQPHPQQPISPPPTDGMHSYTQPPQMTYQQQHMFPEKPCPQVVTQEALPYSHAAAARPRSTWTFGLFDCFSPLSTCCLATWCPCFLYGRTYAREHGQGETCGAGLMCCAWYCSTQMGLYGFLQCITRGSQRQRYGIESNICSDFLLSCCCSCCTMIQEEKESLVRVAGIDPVTKVRYQPVGQGMHYPA